MFSGLRQVGSDTELRGNVRCGSVLIEEMTMQPTTSRMRPLLRTSPSMPRAARASEPASK